MDAPDDGVELEDELDEAAEFQDGVDSTSDQTLAASTNTSKGDYRLPILCGKA